MAYQQGPAGSAHVNFSTGDNVSWLDGVQFQGPTGYYDSCGCTGPTGPTMTPWQLTGTFNWDIRGARNWGPTGPSLSLTSQGQPNSVIVVDDPVNLILHANVTPAILLGAANVGATGPGLVPGRYVHALRMTQAPNIYELLHGEFELTHGV